MTKPIIFKARKAPKAYKLDPEKLKGASQSILPYLFGSNLHYSEDYEYFDKIKYYLDIPEEPKSLEELSQELEEKFENLLVKTKRKFAVSKESAEYHYNQFCKKQDGDFEYARENGFFPLKYTLSGTFDGSYLIANGDGGLSWSSSYGSTNAGYYQISSNTQFWMTERPNRLVRTCAKIFLGLVWKDA